MSGYKAQDLEAKREFNMTTKYLNDLAKKQKYLCIKCNTARKNLPLKGFHFSKLLQFNLDRLVYSIDKEEKDIYAKMKEDIAGGPSIIFNRYGYDANALYLWALGNDMPCGRLTTIDAYPGIVYNIQFDKIFGFF
ncbi:hypothetical protein PC110_g22222 [Phytophthora cactorum]|uniref:Uncharacterized protein n=1 Tax=Phytophthora cactorum TaxID=29920 RepID=A0A329R9F4_9STRA|nr:hypothetical protein PC110_g22222 [Phytophthora cactorum]